MNKNTMWDEEVVEETKAIVDFWGGKITDIKEVRNLIPPTNNVKLIVSEVKVNSHDKEGKSNAWKTLAIKYKLVDGVQLGEDVKYKNTIVNGDNICYFANLDSGRYDMKNTYFSKGQFLLELKKLCHAVGFTCDIVKGGITDQDAESLADHIKGKIILGNIVQKPKQEKNEDGKYVDTEEMLNMVKGVKALPETMLV